MIIQNDFLYMVVYFYFVLLFSSYGSFIFIPQDKEICANL